MWITKWRLSLTVLTMVLAQISISEAVECFDCVGRDCMNGSCMGDYCLVSKFAPSWGGSALFGEPEVVKGCGSGSMLKSGVKSHCEYAESSDNPFKCICNGEDYCNSGKSLQNIEREDVELIQCVCNGAHCMNEKTCVGELCTYVKHHKTNQVAQGCINSSLPLIEKRTIGSCMAPPITGSMHHYLAKDPQNLLFVESCICGTDYCNKEKPTISVSENEKCRASVEVTTMGATVTSKNGSCMGEYCFKATIKSKLGMMSSYETYGCASFTGEHPLREERNSTGCATFTSESVETETCFKKNYDVAIEGSHETKDTLWNKTVKKFSSNPKRRVEVEHDDKEEDKKNYETSTQRPLPQKPTQSSVTDCSHSNVITIFALIILCILGSGTF